MEEIAALIAQQGVALCGAHLLVAVDTLPSSFIDSLIPLLPAWRQEEVLALRRREHRRESVLSYLLLAQLLRDDYGITTPGPFSYDAHGKPSLLSHRDIFFNISHCRTAVAVVVDKAPVGIDVECRGRYKEALAQHLLNDEEYAALLSSPDRDRTFTRLWTQKEATVKLTGEGIYTDLPNTLTSHPEVALTTGEHGALVCSVARFLPRKIINA